MATRRFDPYTDEDPDEMEWITFVKGVTQTPFGVWLERNLPSTVRKDQGYGWICVRNKSTKSTVYEELEDFEGLFSDWERHLADDKPVTYEIIKDLALKYSILCGKWMLFSDQGGKADHLWSLIASSIIKYDLPCHSAKVSAHDDETGHVICIYNTDFSNTDEVLEAEKAIRLTGIKGRLLYKPDIYTYLLIYARNEWGLKPYIMTSEFNLKTRSSVIENCLK